MAKDVVHQGRRSWWDGKVVTRCGITFPKGREEQQGVFASVTCPACKAAKK
jgi:hypothetical protein